MIEKDAVEQLKEKAQIDYHRAVGMWDLVLGLAIVLFGAQMGMKFSYGFVIFGISVGFGIREFQKRVIYPRLGRVEFNEKGKKQGQLSWIILYTMVLLCVVGLMDYWNSTMKFYLSILWVLFIIFGGFLRRTIFYIYGCAVFVTLFMTFFITNSIVLLVITVAAVVLTYILLRVFVYDRIVLEPAKTRAGITAHLFVGVAAMGLAGYLVLRHFNPEQTASIIAQMTVYKYFYLGIATTIVVFLIGFAYRLKSFYLYSAVLAVLSIVWKFHVLPRPYFIGVFMLFGIIVLSYRLALLRKFLRDNPVLDKTE